MAFTLSSPAFSNGQAIPAKYTCDGENLSPPLQWSGAPKVGDIWRAAEPYMLAQTELVGTYAR